MTVETVGTVLSLVVGFCSAAATAYVWLLRRWRERPELTVDITSAVKHIGDGGRRAQWLTQFAPPESVFNKIWPSYRYLMFEAEVFNHSVRPNVVRDVRASLRRKDGGWQPFTTAFVPGPRHTDGPFSRVWWYYDTNDGDGVRAHDDMAVPEPQAVPLGPEQGVRLQLVLWVEVPHTRLWVRWSRVHECDRVAAAGEALTAELATPLEVRLEVGAESGGEMVFELVPAAEEPGWAVRQACA